MKPPRCRLCEHEHWNNQPHVFPASNSASNRSASNRGKETSGQGVEQSRKIEVRQEVAPAGKAGAAIAGTEKVALKQRWSREFYNAYQRDLMQKRRALARAQPKPA